jgi:hypothetical protein
MLAELVEGSIGSFKELAKLAPNYGVVYMGKKEEI